MADHTAFLCRQVLFFEREAHLIGANIEVEVSRIIDKLRKLQPKE